MAADRNAVMNMLRRSHLFRAVDDQKLEIAANLMELVTLSGGETVYSVGDPADYFYYIVEGHVRVLRSPAFRNQVIQPEVLEEDDYFGEEVLETRWPRQAVVDTLTDVTLARISVQNFIILLDEIPVLENRLQLILDSYRLRLKTRMSWPDADEAIYFIARKHVFFLLTKLLPLAVVGVFPICGFTYWFLSNPMVISFVLLSMTIPIIALWLVWIYIDWTNDYYIITSKRIVYQERVIFLYDSRQESPTEAIQSTTISTTQWGRWFKFGNLAIRTYIGTIPFRNLGNPEQVQAMVQEQQLRTQFRETRTEISRIRGMLDRRIRYGIDQPYLPRPMKPPPQPDPMRVFLSTMFHLRYESGGAVIFRTHWFILVKKIFFPTMIIIGILGLFTYAGASGFDTVSLQATCGVLSLFLIIAFIWWAYQYMDWHNDVYLITSDQVVDVNKKPLGKEERQAAPMKNILSVEYKRVGILGLLLNYGTVYIRVGDQQLTFDNVLNPSEVQRELFHRLAKKNYEEKIKQAEADRIRLADWIATYNEWQQNHQGSTHDQ
jgi:hypothetical protein